MDRLLAAFAGDFARIDKGAVATYLRAREAACASSVPSAPSLIVEPIERLTGSKSSGGMLSMRRLVVFARRRLKPAAIGL